MKSYRHAYIVQRRDAGYRGIDFLLSFDEWITIWKESGHLHERGKRRGQYVMARYGDIGPYAVSNVRIVPQEENHREASLGKAMPPESRAKMSVSGRLKIFTDRHRANIAVAGIGNTNR